MQTPHLSAGTDPAEALPLELVAVFALSIHADYRCRHSGACCSADWDVPVEVPVYRTLRDALDQGRVRPAAEALDAALVTGPDLPHGAGAMLARTASGDCIFFHRGTGLCVVHRDLGEPALPATCRHFPRVAVRDARGTFLTLSHFCPTAASTLFRDDVPLAIVESPAAFPPREYEGLVVHPDAWPPLLHPRMLMDLEGYSAWERHMVRRCADPAVTPESVIATLMRDARVLRGGVLGWLDHVLSPVMPAGTPAERARFDSVAPLSRYFGGMPRVGEPRPADADPARTEQAITLLSLLAALVTFNAWLLLILVAEPYAGTVLTIFAVVRALRGAR